MGIVVLSTLVFSQCASSSKKNNEDGWTEATGVGAIQEGRIGKAKDDALLDAKQTAVKQVLGSSVKGAAAVKDGVLESSSIKSRTEGFIEKFEILEQKAVSAYEYQVRIRAKVNQAELEKVMEEAIASAGRPKMMLIIEETGNPQKMNPPVSQVEFEAIFVGKGFPFVDKGTVEKIISQNQSKIRSALKGDKNMLQSLGVDAGAEVILFGTTSISKTAIDSLEGMENMKTYHATTSLRAIDVNTGDILSSAQNTGSTPHINANTGIQVAIKKASEKVADAMIPVIIKKWDPNKTQSIRLLVTGLDFQGTTNLVDKILQLRGVDAVNHKGTQGAASILQVEFHGSSFNLVTRILEIPEYKSTKVGDVKPGSAHLSFR